MDTSNTFSCNQHKLGELILNSTGIKTHAEFLTWAQGGLQEFLPHALMIAAWGDFALGIIYYDIISNIPGARTQIMQAKEMALFLKRLYVHWLSKNRVSSQIVGVSGLIRCRDIQDVQLKACMQNMKSALLHGIKDVRGGNDSFYVLLGTNAEVAPERNKAFHQILPFIDATLRQIDHMQDYLPQQDDLLQMNMNSAAIDEPVNVNNEFNLSDRELEVVGWVCAGKTNVEIGMILDISAFTVKNHLKRIFIKLDVINRSQAVAKIRNLVYSQ